MKGTTLKVVIPMAGLGTRLRPQTWSKPKQLVSVAGKAVLDHVLDSLHSLPNPENIELINIVGYLGDQIEASHSPILPTRRSRTRLCKKTRSVSRMPSSWRGSTWRARC